MTNKIDVKYYTYSVTWSADDNEFVGLCKEFPGLSWLDKDSDKAFHGIRDLVDDAIGILQANNKPIPKPLGVNTK